MPTPKIKRTTSPAFQFYPESWFSSSKVSAMSHTERGIYIDLLARCWLDHGLPTDIRRIAALVHIPPARFERIWSSGALCECFVERGGKLVNPRQERERQKQTDFRRRQIDNGSKGGRPTKSHSETQLKPNPLERVSISKARALETEIETEASGVLVLDPQKESEPLDKAFEDFQSAYPSHRKKGGRMIWESFIEQANKAGGAHVLMAALMNHRQSEQWIDSKHIPAMDKWLEEERWRQHFDNGPKVETSKTAGNRAVLQRFIERGRAS
jgi:uncharacterized protein YdaU (DUF1376 family)